MVFPVGGQRGAGLGVALESWPGSQEALLPTALPQKQWKSETFSSLCFHCKQGMKAGPSPPGCSAPPRLAPACLVFGGTSAAPSVHRVPLQSEKRCALIHLVFQVQLKFARARESSAPSLGGEHSYAQ